METITVEVTDKIRVKVMPDELFDFLMTNQEAGMAFGLEENTLRSYKGKKHKADLQSGLHTTERKIPTSHGLHTTNLLTKSGVIKLAELLDTPTARRVHEWASNFSTKSEVKKVANSDDVRECINGMLKVMVKYEMPKGASNEMLAWIEKLENLNIGG